MLVTRDARGRRAMTAEELGRAPVRGHEVVLTLSRELQDIAERALRDAVGRMGAVGGDVVILDPHTGELRALASHRTNGSFSGVPALSEPFEPGSTLKPFFAAALLAAGSRKPDDARHGDGVYLSKVHDTECAPGPRDAAEVNRHSSKAACDFSSRLPRACNRGARDAASNAAGCRSLRGHGTLPTPDN